MTHAPWRRSHRQVALGGTLLQDPHRRHRSPVAGGHVKVNWPARRSRRATSRSASASRCGRRRPVDGRREMTLPDRPRSAGGWRALYEETPESAAAPRGASASKPRRAGRSGPTSVRGRRSATADDSTLSAADSGAARRGRPRTSPNSEVAVGRPPRGTARRGAAVRGRARPERHRRDVDDDLVEEPRVGELPGEVSSADDPHVLAAGRPPPLRAPTTSPLTDLDLRVGYDLALAGS